MRRTKPAPEPTEPAAVLPSIGETAPPLDRLTYRMEDLATTLGISRRTIERERSAGRFPKPDRIVGKMPLWKPETIRGWIDKGGP